MVQNTENLLGKKKIFAQIRILKIREITFDLLGAG